MKYRIDIDTGNAAFGDDEDDNHEAQRDNEVARILEAVALSLKTGAFYGARHSLKLHDSNGNTVGHITLQQD